MRLYGFLNDIFAQSKRVTSSGGLQFKQLWRTSEQRARVTNCASSRNLSFSNIKMSKYTIVMVRHGESEWNKLNLFCGWYDANLSDKGE